MKHELTNYGLEFNDPFMDLFFDGYAPRSKNAMSLRTDIRDDGNDYVIETELPGVNKEDVKVTYDREGYLTIQAKREQVRNESEKNGAYLHKERSWGTASRSFYFGNIDEKSVNAKMENGILTLRIPKEQKTQKDTSEIAIM